MLAEIQQFSSSPVYSITIESEPEKTKHWFRATEVCKLLGHSDAYRAVTQICKEWQYREIQAGKGRPALYVCESGVYRLILRSKSKTAIEFQDWLTEEVLPKLRASGGYIMPTATSEQLKGLQSEIAQLQSALGLSKLEVKIEQAHAKVTRILAKKDSYDRIALDLCFNGTKKQRAQGRVDYDEGLRPIQEAQWAAQAELRALQEESARLQGK